MNKNHLMLYDFLLVKGGAEAMTLDLCQQHSDMDLCVGFVNKDIFDDESTMPTNVFELTGITHLLGWQSIKVANAFSSGKGRIVADYDKVIFSGSNGPVAVKHRDKSKGGNMLYCHTPPRFIYDLKDHYLSSIPMWQRPLLQILIAYMRPQYERAIKQMDVIIANSINIQKRIKHYLGLDSVVIYPPCAIDNFKWLKQEDFYLSTARVEPYKRVKAIVEAFMKMPDKKLVVASGGSQLPELQEMAFECSNIHFTGWCETEQLRQLMGSCIATLYLPIEEDFGMSPVESMAAGKPVIGVAEGGVIETVIDGKTGVLCPANPSVDDIVEAVNELDTLKSLAMREDCQIHAKNFGSEIFFKKMDVLLSTDNDKLAEVAKTLDASA